MVHADPPGLEGMVYHVGQLIASAQLRASAQRNRLSLNSEILFRLEQDIRRPVLDLLLQDEMLRALAGQLPRVGREQYRRPLPLARIMTSPMSLPARGSASTKPPRR